MYELGSLFWYKAVFMGELMIAEALMTLRLKRKPRFVLRVVSCIVLCFGFSFAMPIVSYGAAWCSFMFLAMFAATVASIKLCFDESWLTVLFCAITAYTVQHTAFQTFDFINVALGLSSSDFNVYGSSSFQLPMLHYGSGGGDIGADPFAITLYFYVYGMTYFLCWLFADRFLKNRKKLRLGGVDTVLLGGVILLFDIVFGSIVTYYSQKVFDKVYVILLNLYNVFCCVLAIFLQFDIARRRKTETDLSAVKKLWKKDREQYEISKRNIELINIKCHDLKHQVRAIGDRSALDATVVKEIEGIIDIYDSVVKTGNAAFDVILTEKSLLCSNNDIKLCCIADGAALEFMAESDLYSLFGNLIDNAIEAVNDLDEGKRVISLSVKRVNDFLSVNIRNRYEKDIRFAGNLPVSTKSEAGHGYGMKSVQMLCEKYGGELSVSAKNNLFNVNIVFPVQPIAA